MRLRNAFANLLIALGLALLGMAIWSLAQQYRASGTLAGQESEDGVLLAITAGRETEPLTPVSRRVTDIGPDPWMARPPDQASQTGDEAVGQESSESVDPSSEEIGAQYLPAFEDEGTPELPADVPPAVEIPQVEPAMPDRIVAPAIGLDARVVPMGWKVIQRDGQSVSEWVIPEYAAGWHVNSALPRTGGNTVLSGHNNIKGEVFRYLSDFELGDEITLYAGDWTFSYVVEEKYIVREKGMPDEVRRRNAQWMMPTADERLTLISCWPYWTNTHRIIIVARPVQSLEFQASDPPAPEYR